MLLRKALGFWLLCLLVSVLGYVWFGAVVSNRLTSVGPKLGPESHKLNKRLFSKVTVATNGSIVIDDKETVNKSEYGRNASHDDKHQVHNGIVTMFTTIRDRECRKAIHERLIRNWAALSPRLEPVLFVPVTEYNTSSWIEPATSHNWTVRKLYALRHDLPIITAMFKEALRISTTPFVGYANADILFDESLITTLRYLRERLDVDNEMVLIVGKRRNVKIATIHLGTGSDLATISRLDFIRPFHGIAQDYFIVSRRGLPWQDIPDFVVGRNGYDNWLVVKAQLWHITLIDASKTVLALHQSGIDGYMSGSRTVPKETRRWNIMLAKGFSYARGSTNCAPFYMKGECSVSSRVSHRVHCNQIYNLTLERRTPKRRLRSKV